ncbi:GntR family transcriptional regulator [Bordetella genomosp. 12]|uniref:GntR family transcriptional regulator n=1 Tax=Bordetella genomosp. 12 TaxID=463035 RepID=A0A261VAS5_9BORD|nr:GntR family transcriptional regulator [Bordetella genomosp. 12]OZI70917.1 GntR family transcriptional regulator [Bordetella genomosp. 12]
MISHPAPLLSPDPNPEGNIGALLYQRLSQALMEGGLKPGERLRIRELAETMGTSVTPVRDAILRLVQDGALVMRSPRDIRVYEVSLAEYLEIRDIRLELEGMAAARTAEVATLADIARLESIVAANENALKAGDTYSAVGLNQRFHFEYSKIARMPILLDVLQRLWLKMGPLIAQVYASSGREMIDGHYPLLTAIRNRDPKAARIAVQTDIIAGGEPILLLKQRGEAAVED